MSDENRVIPFGKYKGRPLSVMRQDQSYLDWCAGQEGIRERYPWIFSITINNGVEPAETPEHNKYQALFLDEDFAKRFYDFVRPGCRKDTDEMTVGFEVVRREHVYDPNAYSRMRERVYGPADVEIRFRSDEGMRIEIKPVMGDDYPAVLRQMQANRCSTLYLVEYTGAGATLEQVKKMFATAGFRVVMHFDFWSPF